jgi:hypothetical protein
VLVFYAFAFTMILQQTIALSFILKVAIMVVVIAPLAVCMGMPFPSGLLILASREEHQVPWAWGVNACISVISAPLAIVLAVEFGFAAVMWTAAGSYCLPWIAILAYRKAHRS